MRNTEQEPDPGTEAVNAYRAWRLRHLRHLDKDLENPALPHMRTSPENEEP